MFNAVKKFLALHHHVALPDIGNFVVETTPAQIDFTNRTVHSAQKKIVFTNKKMPAEKKFYDFLACELHINEVEAIRAFTDFTSRLHDELDNNQPVYFKGIGTLLKQTSGVIFKGETMPEYFPELVAERVIRKNVAHTVRVGENEKTSDEMQAALHKPQTVKKEKWWIAASILGAIGVAAIIIYYLMYS